ncbi:MAG: hypothetical protein J6K69_03230 [Candidatus Methanomethylophilaceae archaeon]|nr:hypothetical protein [Candidatus Methanomethylophilaceae archaeon]
MSSSIDVNMTVCDKKVKVTVTTKDDGTMDVEIDSDCHYLKHYAENLRNITQDDITNFETSRINKEDVRGNMSMICLAPIAVYQAAWMECGMMSKKNFQKAGCITMDIADRDA